MVLKRALVTILFFVISHSGLAASSSVMKLLESRKPPGWGDPYVLGEVSGVLRGEVRFLVVLYGYQIGEERDRNHWQYLVAFAHGNAATPSILVGGGPQRFQSLDIEGGTIIISGMAYADNDAMCCPSVHVQSRYILLNEQLVAEAIGT